VERAQPLEKRGINDGGALKGRQESVWCPQGT